MRLPACVTDSVMTTDKQKRAVQIYLENPGKSVGAAMREAGYSEATAKNPKDLTQTDAWALAGLRGQPARGVVVSDLPGRTSRSGRGPLKRSVDQAASRNTGTDEHMLTLQAVHRASDPGAG